MTLHDVAALLRWRVGLRLAFLLAGAALAALLAALAAAAGFAALAAALREGAR